MFDWIEPMMKSIILGQVRTWGAALGGVLVTSGILTGTQVNDFIGVVFFLASVAFSVLDKFVVKKKLIATAQTGRIPTR